MNVTERYFQSVMAENGKALTFIGMRKEGFYFGHDLLGLVYRPDFVDECTGDYYEVKSVRGSYLSSAFVLCGFRYHNRHLTLHVMTQYGERCENRWRFSHGPLSGKIEHYAEAYHIDRDWLENEINTRYRRYNHLLSGKE